MKPCPTSGRPTGPRPSGSGLLAADMPGWPLSGRRAVLFHRVENEERVEAIDAASGKERWHFAIPTSYVSGISPDDGPRCVPLVHGDKVIVFGVQGTLACLRLADGKKEWSHDTHAEFRTPEGYFGAGSSPIVEGDKVIVNVGGAKAGAGVVAFSLASGKVLWKVGHDDASYSSPIRRHRRQDAALDRGDAVDDLFARSRKRQHPISNRVRTNADRPSTAPIRR